MTTADQSGKSAGFTLIECLVAMFILGMCMAGTCAVAVSVKTTGDRARQQYVATNIARNRAERLRNFDFAQIDSFGESNVRVNASGSPDTVGEYRRTTSVSLVSTDLKEVAVNVDILDRKTWAFAGHKVSIRTYLARFQERPQ
jgi:prepilin-type N-terminal cleavage/methylation domain-containing protein